jgi:hypothetical protein
MVDQSDTLKKMDQVVNAPEASNDQEVTSSFWEIGGISRNKLSHSTSSSRTNYLQNRKNATPPVGHSQS